MKTVSGGKRRDCEQVMLPEYVRVSMMPLLEFASHFGIENPNSFDPAQGSPVR